MQSLLISSTAPDDLRPSTIDISLTMDSFECVLTPHSLSSILLIVESLLAKYNAAHEPLDSDRSRINFFFACAHHLPFIVSHGQQPLMAQSIRAWQDSVARSRGPEEPEFFECDTDPDVTDSATSVSDMSSIGQASSASGPYQLAPTESEPASQTNFTFQIKATRLFMIYSPHVRTADVWTAILAGLV